MACLRNQHWSTTLFTNCEVLDSNDGIVLGYTDGKLLGSTFGYADKITLGIDE